MVTRLGKREMMLSMICSLVNPELSIGLASRLRLSKFWSCSS